MKLLSVRGYPFPYGPDDKARLAKALGGQRNNLANAKTNSEFHDQGEKLLLINSNLNHQIRPEGGQLPGSR
jgi:hypothetical protein